MNLEYTSRFGLSEPTEPYSQPHEVCGCVSLLRIKPRDRLYHYLSLGQFVAWVESGKVALRQVKEWDDVWEQPIRRLRSMDDDDDSCSKVTRRYENSYGHSWTRSRESDGMWRIFSHDKLGLRVMTKAERFSLLEGVHEAILAPIRYGNEPYSDALSYDEEFPRPGYVDAFLKRTPFQHEKEVRLIVNSDQCVSGVQPADGVLLLPLDPARFICEIAIDPRAEKWYVEAVCTYCARVGLSCKPTQSGLRSQDPFEAGLFPRSRRSL